MCCCFTVLAITHIAANNLGANAARILQATDVEQGIGHVCQCASRLGVL
jgi:hypothetical protein